MFDFWMYLNIECLGFLMASVWNEIEKKSRAKAEILRLRYLKNEIAIYKDVEYSDWSSIGREPRRVVLKTVS